MKKIYSIIAALFITLSIFSQAPQKMSYQAVIRNSSDALITSTPVTIRVSIIQGSISGASVYVEIHTPTTNTNGLASIEIGGGSAISGSFSTINWAAGPYFIKTETDPSGGTSYSISGTSQLLSVPYALHAKTVEIDNVQDGDTTYWKANSGNISYTGNNVGIGTSSPSAPLTIESTVGSQIKLNRSQNIASLGVGIDFNLKNSASNYMRYGAIYGGIKTNTSGAELGFISLLVANGDGTTDGAYGEEVIRATTEKVTIKDVLNIVPRSTAPASPAKGDMYFDNTLNKLRVYDGTTWQNCW